MDEQTVRNDNAAYDENDACDSECVPENETDPELNPSYGFDGDDYAYADVALPPEVEALLESIQSLPYEADASSSGFFSPRKEGEGERPVDDFDGSCNDDDGYSPVSEAYGRCEDDLMAMTPHELGKRGEDAACAILARQGYEIIDRNWECPAGEADIVAWDGDCLVFIEVKTRMGPEHGLPDEALTAEKRHRYEKISGFWLKEKGDVETRFRFDFIGVMVLSAHRAVMRHTVNAFGRGLA